MKIINQKKAQIHHGFNPVYFLIAGIIFLAMAFVLISTTNAYMRAFSVHDKDIPTHVYAYRAINTCLAYQDGLTQRYYPGIVDISKYNEDTLKACFRDTSKSFNIELRDLQKSESHGRILLGFGATMSIKSYPVMIMYDEENINKGELLFGVEN